MDAQEKEAKLIEWLREKGRIAIAFSGGVDSTYLLRVAIDALGSDNVLPMHAQAQLHSRREEHEAEDYARDMGAHLVVLPMDMHAVPGLCDNPPDRCYICKKELFEKIWDIATKEGLNAVAEGSNMDDNGDYRPGLQAVAELGVKSPLRHSELYKADIRALSKDLGLPTWEKQSFACLSSRFVYGETITKEKLGMVDKAEQLLLDLGFHQLRVRIHGTLARIEVLPDELQKVLENRNQIVKAFKEYGFTYVTMDLQGYRMGSMNETLKK